MECVTGKSIVNGIAIGEIALYDKGPKQVKRMHREDTKAELLRYEKAKEQAVAELNALYEKAIKEVGEINAQVFLVHAMMLEDDDYNDSVKNIVMEQKVNAEYAVARTGDIFAEQFASMEDEYFRARSVDIKDISERVIALLSGSATQMKQEKPVVIAAEELTPSETIQMEKEMILAFVTEIGSKNSHTAILARSMGIPAISEITLKREWDGKLVVVDGDHGKLYIEPDDATLKAMQEKKEEEEKSKKLLESMKGKETITGDGKKIKLYANIGKKDDVASVLFHDAEGIGLFRTEFLYLERNDYPTEEEQFQVYKYVAETMAGKKVIIRTLDIGADKQADYFGLKEEENPAMGYRAIRICLDRTDLFKTQLRAILRASLYGNISIMFPMIISVSEVKAAKALLEEANQELKEEGISCGNVEIGVMIETPAAVMISDELAKEVDFFSIGTNDLTQYTLAIDRQNPNLDGIYDAHHPAVLKMIQLVIQNGHAGGAWVGICGELAADTTLTETFLAMGIDELSVTPSLVLKVRKAVRGDA